jgi:hypothetical protein
MSVNHWQKEKQKTTTVTIKISRLSFVTLVSAVLLLSSIAATQQLLLVTNNNNNAAYGQPSPQCEPGFTFNQGVCEQPATSAGLRCPDDRDWTLEEGIHGEMVCNLYATETDELQVNEETGEVFCNDPFELNPIEEPTECRYRYVTETTEPIPVFDCPNGGDLNTETLTCQMRPGRGESLPQCEPGFTFNQGVCEQPATLDGCPNGGDLNTETLTCQMRPGRSGNGDVPDEEGG